MKENEMQAALGPALGRVLLHLGRAFEEQESIEILVSLEWFDGVAAISVGKRQMPPVDAAEDSPES